MNLKLISFQIKVKKKEKRSPYLNLFHTSPLCTISHLPFPVSFVPGLILCGKEQSLFFLPPCSIYHSLLCIFLRTNKPCCCLAVIAGPLYRCPTCVLREVMLFEHSSLATSPCLPTVPSGAAAGLYWMHNHTEHKQSDSLTERKCPVYLSECLGR